MITIDGYTFRTLRGQVDQAANILEQIERPGVDGTAYRDIGKRGSRWQINTMSYFATKAAAATAIFDYKALQGTLVTFIDNLGTTHTNVAVRNIRHIDTRETPLLIIDGFSGPAWQLYMTWTLQSSS